MSNKILPTPKTDVVFHSLFRQGNENITKALVSAIINMPISSIDLSQDRHLITNSPNDKLGILDLKAILNDNTICNVELQLVNNKDTIPRLLFYWSNLFYNQLCRGDNYNTLNKTISIAILDYNLEDINSTHFPHSIWKISNPFTLTILTDLFELHIIEIPKALKYLENNPDDLVSQWMLFLSEPNNREVLNIMKSNEEIEDAMKKLEEITSDAELMRIIELRKKAIRDYNSGMINATNEGIKQGIEQKSIEIAKNMLSEKIDICTISKITGLSKEELNKLVASKL